MYRWFWRDERDERDERNERDERDERDNRNNRSPTMLGYRLLSVLYGQIRRGKRL